MVCDHAVCGGRGRGGLRRYAAFSALRGKIQQSHVIIGANEAGCAPGAAAARRIRIWACSKASSTIATPSVCPDMPQEQLLGGMTDIVNYVRLNSVSSIYICLPMRADERVTKLLEELKDTTASVYFVPDIYHVRPDAGAGLRHRRHSDARGVRDAVRGHRTACIKRASDIVFSTVLLLLMWPVLLLLAVGVRVSSPGPDPVPPAPLWPVRRSDQRLQVPHHDGVRGRRRRSRRHSATIRA